MSDSLAMFFTGFIFGYGCRVVVELTEIVLRKLRNGR